MNDTKQLPSGEPSTDITLNTPDERVRFCLRLCEALGLDPRFRPIEVIEFQGRWVPYLNRGGTDALARKHNIQRTTIERPRVISVGNVELVSCVARATSPDGRYEERLATVPLRDHANALMKCETKAIRRATIALLGCGLLDESELDTMRVSLALADMARAEALSAYVQDSVDRLRAELPSLTSATQEAKTAVWQRYVSELSQGAAITTQEAHKALYAAIKR